MLAADDGDDLNLQGQAAHTRGDSSLPSGQSGIPSHTWRRRMMIDAVRMIIDFENSINVSVQLYILVVGCTILSLAVLPMLAM